MYEGWAALRLEQISTIFKTAFGELGINASATASRVRPLFEWQYGGNWAGELPDMQTLFGSQHAVGYYLYGGGGGWYVDDTDGGFSDAEFANPNFDSVTGNQPSNWTTSGTVGVDAAQTQAATSESLGTAGNSAASGWYGYEFTTGSSPLYVYDLGRWVISGNSGSAQRRVGRRLQRHGAGQRLR